MTNLLMPNQPRILRFYLQKQANNRPVKDDHQLCTEFLSRRFAKVMTGASVHVRSDDLEGRIVETHHTTFPLAPADPTLARVLAVHDEAEKMETTLTALGVSDFREINDLRRRLTSLSHPYLRAI